MVNIQVEVRRAERAVKSAGRSVAELCRAAKVHRATWQRWKAGEVSPLLATWSRVEGAVKRLANGGGK